MFITIPIAAVFLLSFVHFLTLKNQAYTRQKPNKVNIFSLKEGNGQLLMNWCARKPNEGWVYLLFQHADAEVAEQCCQISIDVALRETHSIALPLCDK